MVAVEYHADLKEVQSDAVLARLLGEGSGAAPFDRLEWWQMLATHCGKSPRIVVARSEAGYLVLPLEDTNSHLEGMANWYTFRLRPVASAGADREALMAAIAADLSDRSHRIVLGGVPNEDRSADLIERAFASAGWTVRREQCDVNHILNVAGRSYADYLAARPGRLRTTLKRKSAKVDAVVLDHFDHEVWNAYEAIYRQSWKPEEGSPEFLRAFAMAEAKAGRLRLGIARAGGEAIASQMWTVEGGTAFIHKLAHLEAARALSPGTVLSAALFRHVIDVDRVDLVDFGTGDDGYKRDWMEEVRPRYRLDMYRPLAPQNWLVFARSGLRRLADIGKRG